MLENNHKAYFKNPMTIVAFLFFIVLSVWWIKLQPFNMDESLVDAKYIWGSSYQIIAIWGGLCGLFISRLVGGLNSVFGKSIVFFSLGLLFQALGQSVYSYFNLFAGIQAPYPSFGDVGFFGSIIFYILGIFYLGKISGLRISLQSFHNKIQAIALPVLLLALSYWEFLKGYEFDWSQKLKIFLDFGYPLGQAFYLALAILVLILSRNILGGIMKRPIMFFLIALLLQYVADFNFLYQVIHETWWVGSYGDFLYMLSYFSMTLALINLGVVFEKMRSGN